MWCIRTALPISVTDTGKAVLIEERLTRGGVDVYEKLYLVGTLRKVLWGPNLEEVELMWQ